MASFITASPPPNLRPIPLSPSTPAALPSSPPSPHSHTTPLTGHRYFTYNIVSGALGVLFILGLLYLIHQRTLLPGIVILGSFVLFVLWLVGLVVVSVELWGPQGNVAGNCQLYVQNRQSVGQSLDTLAWLEQNGICEFFFFFCLFFLSPS